jgi:predicted ABC-type ATPase
VAAGRSFAAETVFSHPSKLDFLRTAKAQGYQVHLHVVLVPLELALRRVVLRSDQGGHSVPARKVRERFRRLWALVDNAIQLADEAVVYDNTSAARPFREVARYAGGAPVEERMPVWSPLAPVGRSRRRR